MFVFTCARDLAEVESTGSDSIDVSLFFVERDDGGCASPFAVNGTYEPTGAMKDLLVTQDEMDSWKRMFGEYRKSECSKDDFRMFVRFLSGWTRFVGATGCGATLRELIDHRRHFLRFLSAHKDQFSPAERMLAHELYDSFMDLFDVGDAGCAFASSSIRTRKRPARERRSSDAD